MKDMNKRKVVLVGIILAGLCFVSFSYAFSASIRTSHTSGIVSNMGIYLDQACATPLTTINWGTNIQPGATITLDAWIKNVASYTVTLSNATSAWTPSNAPTYIHLNWDGTDKTLAHEALALKTTFTLTVDANIVDSNPLIGDFSFDITITGTG
jgi:hypothetical protein